MPTFFYGGILFAMSQHEQHVIDYARREERRLFIASYESAVELGRIKSFNLAYITLRESGYNVREASQVALSTAKREAIDIRDRRTN